MDLRYFEYVIMARFILCIYIYKYNVSSPYSIRLIAGIAEASQLFDHLLDFPQINSIGSIKVV